MIVSLCFLYEEHSAVYIRPNNLCHVTDSNFVAEQLDTLQAAVSLGADALSLHPPTSC